MIAVEELTAEEIEEIEEERARAFGNWVRERRSTSPIINSLRFNHTYAYLGDMLYGSSKESEGCTFELKVNDERKHIHLAFIGVSEHMRNQGKGSGMMTILTGLADQYGYTMDLDVVTKFGCNRRGLIRFYKRFGFVQKVGSTYQRLVKGLKPHAGVNV